MKLGPKEFEAMQSGWRKWYIREIELRTFKKFGLWIKGRDILEVGCGSGYAASLLTAEAPRSYTGLDIMPEQLALARERKLPKARFVEGSADGFDGTGETAFTTAEASAEIAAAVAEALHPDGRRKAPAAVCRSAAEHLA